MAQTFVGIDIGLTKTIIVKSDGDLVLTETGGINRPSLVSFVGGARLVGEEAAAQASSSTTICLSHLLIGKSDLGESNPLLRCLSPGLLQIDSAEPHVLCANLVYNGSPISIPITALLGMYLARQSSRIDTVTGSTGCKLAFVLPPHSSPSVVRAITEACVIAKIEPSRICFVNKIQAMLSAYRRKNATLVSATQAASPKLVLMCDVGASSTSLALIFDDSASANPPTVIAEAFVEMGSTHVDIALFDHFSRGAIPPDSKRGMRLLQGCERLKKLLSQLPEASTVVENMSDEGADMTLALKRAELAELAGPQLSRMADAVRLVISKAQAQDPQGGAPAVQVVELLGGGSRVPAVQALLTELFPFATLGARFDEASVAVGAALVAAAGISEAMGHESLPQAKEGQELASPAASVGLSEQALRDLTAQEEAWQHNDGQLTLLLHSRNAIESTLLRFRSLPALHPAQASLLPQGLGAYLDEQEEWLWSNPDADLDAVTAKRAALDSSLAQQCAAFLAAAEEAKRAKDGEAMNVDLDVSAGNGSEGGLSEVDAKIADRSRLTTKNLAEATDLLASASTELQVRAALARFNKALGHCLSIPEQGAGGTGGPGAGTKRALGLAGSSPSSSSSSGASHEPQAAQQLVAWKETIHLGLATCYHKLGNVDLAVAACSAAIQAQPSSIAAHRTRSELFVAKKEWERAADDAQVIVRLLSESGQGRAAKTSPPSPPGGDGAELALAKSWAAKLREKAIEEKQKEKKGSGCAVM